MNQSEVSSMAESGVLPVCMWVGLYLLLHCCAAVTLLRSYRVAVSGAHFHPLKLKGIVKWLQQWNLFIMSVVFGQELAVERKG